MDLPGKENLSALCTCVSALASFESSLCGLLLAATRTPRSQSCPCPMGANAGSAGDVDSFAQLLELASFSLPFSIPSFPATTSRERWISERQRFGLLPNSQTRIESSFALISLAITNFPSPNFLVKLRGEERKRSEREPKKSGTLRKGFSS